MRLYLDLYPAADTAMLRRAFLDTARVYDGEQPGFRPCDTAYHDIQHVLDVTLAMARLIHGHEREAATLGGEMLGSRLFQLGVITALYHDVGYIRKSQDRVARNGAKYTLIHVSRGAHFLRDYLPRIGMADAAGVAAELIHFTGFERPAHSIAVPDAHHRLLGNMLGTADIIAQMADRCYLEKCLERLYPEFVTGNITRKAGADGKEVVVFASAEDLLRKTPGFYASAMRRLEQDLGNCVAYAGKFFGGPNLYLEGMEKNLRFAARICDTNDFGLLKRVPPDTLAEFKKAENNDNLRRRA